MCNQSQGYYGSNNTLSPAAQAVLDAAIKVAESPDAEAIASAALQAAADQVVPAEENMPFNLAHRLRWDVMQSVRCQLLAIAAELKAND
jgi:hypothetical protein